MTVPADPPLYPCLSCRQRFPRYRGLCNRCHLRLGRAVRSGETTWTRLETAGLALPAAAAGSAWRRGFRVGRDAGCGR
jgi:predicted amidophosphoribosyltransferase